MPLLPALGFFFLAACTAAALVIGKLTRQRSEDVALTALSGGMGNASTTMGGLLAFLFFGAEGLSLCMLYCLMWYPFMVLVAYPIAHHYTAGQAKRIRLPRLMWQSIWDVRSVGLPLTIAGTVLSGLRVPRPMVIDHLYITESATIITTVLAFFAIGLRISGQELLPALRPSIIVGVIRFILCPLLGVAIFFIFKPWPMNSPTARVFLLESCLPVAITVVGIANIFDIAPRRATAIFIINTLSYLAICVPVLAWIFAR